MEVRSFTVQAKEEPTCLAARSEYAGIGEAGLRADSKWEH